MLRQLSRLGYREGDAAAATLHQGCLIGDGFRRAGVLELDPTCLTRFRQRVGDLAPPSFTPHPIGGIMSTMATLAGPQKITFPEMRESGARGLLVYSADYRRSHSIAVTVQIDGPTRCSCPTSSRGSPAPAAGT
jgi:hypothetical protein